MNNQIQDVETVTILIIDDNPANLQLLGAILTEAGYSVRHALSGAQGLIAIKHISVDLILLDICMPEMDGYEVCLHLKADAHTCHIPVIFLSALNNVLDKVKAFQVGGVDFITKPFQFEEVLARVKTHLTIQNLQHSLQKKNQELEAAFQELKSTQAELINSEKMAALGNLIAGISHEINTPLAAIQSSVNSTYQFINPTLEKLPKLFQSLSLEQGQMFLNLLDQALDKESTYSTKEERLFKRKILKHLTAEGIQDADIIADTLVDMGIYQDIDIFVPLLKLPARLEILDIAYKISRFQTSNKIIKTASDKAAKIIFALKNHARYNQQGEKIYANVIDGIETVITLYQHQLKSGVEVIRNYMHVPSILCDADELNQIWTNLIQNALQAMNYRGVLTIEIEQINQQLQVSIGDTGSGIPAEIQSQIFTQFFTTKPPGEGSGLGLYIVNKVVENHGGKITFTSHPGATIFQVSLPLIPPAS